MRRARPLLGTFVVIDLRARAPEAELERRIRAAFQAVSEVDALMSFHRCDSDLSRLNRARQGRWIAVHPHTARVLSLSNELFTASAGIFDVRCGAALVEWGYLPNRKIVSVPMALGVCPVELDGDRARKTGPWTLDLGGIAKGYAVDRAVECLRAGGGSGLVNAGGDLRVFGRRAWPVFLREPSAPGLLRPFGPLVNGALATSALYFSEKRRGPWLVSPLVDVRKRKPLTRRSSVSVLSADCAVADGLTKIAALAPSQAADLLNRYNSKGLVLSLNGRLRSLN